MSPPRPSEREDSGDFAARAAEKPSDPSVRMVLDELRALRAEVAELRALRSQPPPGALTVREAAARLGCSRDRIFDLLNEGKLTRATRTGKESRVTLASVLALESPASESFPAFPKPPPRAIPFDIDAERRKLATLLAERNGNVVGAPKRHSKPRELVGKKARSPRKAQNTD